MRQLVIESKRAWQSLGKIFYGSTKSEENLKFRKSIYAYDINKNDKFTRENIKIIRPVWIGAKVF